MLRKIQRPGRERRRHLAAKGFDFSHAAALYVSFLEKSG
jgi:hypothetical protein